MKFHIGIDFGSKTAGTTAICYHACEGLKIIQSAKKQDADSFILQTITKLNGLHRVYIDAPLSLPGAFYGKGDDFMFRQVDREVQAMSPMFLGGLTARAMRLQYELKKRGIECIEAYPKMTAQNYGNGFIDLYKGKNTEMDFIGKMDLPLPILKPPENWHQVDAVLAWYAGYRHLRESGNTYGNVDEGFIVA